MAAIKRFFEKKKLDAKFKLAGQGQQLNAQQQSRNTGIIQAVRPVPRQQRVSTESQQAAAAALARLEQQQPADPFANRSLAAIRAQAKREMEAESKQEQVESSTGELPLVKEEEIKMLAVKGVYFKCPLIGPEVLPKAEMESRIKEFLYEQLTEERGLTACLIIHTCNKNKEKVKVCIETLCKYLDNIIANPNEEKYKKIRISNKVYQERVAPIEGVLDFLMAAGFEKRKLPYQETEEDFFIFPEENIEHRDSLQILRDALINAEPICAELDRGLQVLMPSKLSQRMELPPEFFNISKEEIKHEQQQRAELAEKGLMLRTKAMKQRDEQRELRRYRYALIRVRFPNGIILQGTFHVHEKLHALEEFVRENLVTDWWPFSLSTSTGQKLKETDSSLLDLRLVPASILMFNWELSADECILPEGTDFQEYLKPEVLCLVQHM